MPSVGMLCRSGKEKPPERDGWFLRAERIRIGNGPDALSYGIQISAEVVFVSEYTPFVSKECVVISL